ncbi:dTMP kinase [Micavibrio aeruginosavorus]|uniref:dTMP kinase n=1 Tax=Micavibrio aeruginosavorus TaxID=349221 RepID=UPI003F4AE5AF
MARGLFITLEGGEGSGKSTQIRLLAEHLTSLGHDVITTREPGGTPEAEKIRHLLVHRDGGDWTPIAETFLLFAARAMHTETLIKPALAAGKIVISDRFADSTRAYQAYAGGLPLDTVEQINTLALGDFKPDLTLILDMQAADGLARAGKRLSDDNSGEDRFEKKGINFHEKLRDGYLAIAKAEPNRCIVINAAQDIQSVAAAIASCVTQKVAA